MKPPDSFAFSHQPMGNFSKRRSHTAAHLADLKPLPDKPAAHYATGATAVAGADVPAVPALASLPPREWRKRLTRRQYAVLRLGETDPRHMTTARFGLDKCFEAGTYFCAGCGAPLYSSAMKFRCSCGWPAFWTCLYEAARETLDPDGSRSELSCTACGGHLGHIFRGEGFDNPPPAERHCVNSSSLVFVPLATEIEQTVV